MFDAWYLALTLLARGIQKFADSWREQARGGTSDAEIAAHLACFWLNSVLHQAQETEVGERERLRRNILTGPPNHTSPRILSTSCTPSPLAPVVVPKKHRLGPLLIQVHPHLVPCTKPPSLRTGVCPVELVLSRRLPALNQTLSLHPWVDFVADSKPHPLPPDHDNQRGEIGEDGN